MTTQTQTTEARHDELPLLRRDEAGVCRLVLNRPAQRNALSRKLMAALHGELDAIAADHSVRVVVISGAGSAFCSGHDLRELRDNTSPDFYTALFAQCGRLMQRIVSLPQPVIACVNGTASAAGCQLVASCDLAVAAETARFATPGVNIGLFCSTPMVALSRNVAAKHAMHLLLTGEPVSAAHAVRIGLLNEAVAESELTGVVDTLATRIATKSAHTLAVGKQAFYRQMELPLADAYDYAGGVMARNMLAEDAREGIDAFLARREPCWHDR